MRTIWKFYLITLLVLSIFLFSFSIFKLSYQTSSLSSRLGSFTNTATTASKDNTNTNGNGLQYLELLAARKAIQLYPKNARRLKRLTLELQETMSISEEQATLLLHSILLPLQNKLKAKQSEIKDSVEVVKHAMSRIKQLKEEVKYALSGTKSVVNALNQCRPILLTKKDIRKNGVHNYRNWTDTSFKTCAVVGSSATLIGSSCGMEIDHHDAVFRIDSAPTLQYEKDVGEISTFRVTRSPNCAINSIDGYLSSNICIFNGGSMAEKRIYNSLKDMIKLQSPDSWKKWKEKTKLETATDLHLYRHDTLTAMKYYNITTQYHPDGIRLSSGFAAIIASFDICDHVSLYGFTPPSVEHTNTNMKYGMWTKHYYKHKSNSNSNFNAFNNEWDQLKQFIPLPSTTTSKLDTNSGSLLCRDKMPELCVKYAEANLCTLSFVRKYCKKSCELCEELIDMQEILPQTKRIVKRKGVKLDLKTGVGVENLGLFALPSVTTSEPVANSGLLLCKDKMPQTCVRYAKKNLCTLPYVKKYCKKSCKLCHLPVIEFHRMNIFNKWNHGVKQVIAMGKSSELVPVETSDSVKTTTKKPAPLIVEKPVKFWSGIRNKKKEKRKK